MQKKAIGKLESATRKTRPQKMQYNNARLDHLHLFLHSSLLQTMKDLEAQSKKAA